jgi:hypothetical protein
MGAMVLVGVDGRREISRFESAGRENIRGGEHRRPAQPTDAGRGQDPLVSIGLFATPAAGEGLRHRAAGADIGITDERRRGAEAAVFVFREQRERATVGGDELERLGRGAQAIE